MKSEESSGGGTGDPGETRDCDEAPFARGLQRGELELPGGRRAGIAWCHDHQPSRPLGGSPAPVAVRGHPKGAQRAHLRRFDALLHL
jgi:hypothetical protein